MFPSFLVPLLLAILHFIPHFAYAGTVLPASESRYSRAHSLPYSYEFDRRDGWEPVNITNSKFAKRSTSKAAPVKDTTPTNVVQSVVNAINNIWNGMKGEGSMEEVTITWYTGHDLLNPSCWPDPVWNPTDASFACALTLEGWETRPACFRFLELCNSPQKCVFVRVIDTCAGCAPGSKHVDLTKAAFAQLADFDEGVLNVQMRPASDPVDWYMDLWGPKVTLHP